MAAFLLLSPISVGTSLPAILGVTASMTMPLWTTMAGANIGQMLAGYESAVEPDDGIFYDHSKYGIDIMALDDGRGEGLYQGDTKPFLKNFNNRNHLEDAGNNGYELPYFRLATVSGVATPGGPGFHTTMNMPYLAQRTQFFDGIVPHAFVGESGTIGDVDFFTVLFKSAAALATNSLWNDWGSGFVPSWSSKASNVSLFNLPFADTKKWNVRHNKVETGLDFMVPVIASMVAGETAASLLPWDNILCKTSRYLGYIGVIGTSVLVAGVDDIIAQFPAYIGFHGAMVGRVDSLQSEDKDALANGLDKKMLDELVWEKPSVSIVYKPVNAQDKSNKEGGYIGISSTGSTPTEELVEYTTGDGEVDGVYRKIDVKWVGKTEPHVFDFTFSNIVDQDEINRLSNIHIAGWHKGSSVRSIILKQVLKETVDPNDPTKILQPKVIELGINATNCPGYKVNGWTVLEEKMGSITCKHAFTDDEKGEYTMQLKVDPPKNGEKHGVLVNAGREPGGTFVEGTSLVDAKNNDWDDYITFKNRRYQVDANNQIDKSVADMVDYRYASLLVVNKLPRTIEFEVDDLQPDRMKSLTIDFNDGTSSIEFVAAQDPNKFSTPYEGFANLVDSGLVNVAGETYFVKGHFGGKVCAENASVFNPVDAWGRWTLDLDELQKICGIEKIQPFLEGRNKIKVTSVNRWMMHRTQKLEMFIPGALPTLSLEYPLANEVFCGFSGLSFHTNLIYTLSSPLTAQDVEVYYMDGNVKKGIKDLVVESVVGNSNAYTIKTIGSYNWPQKTNISITIKPKILGVGATPYTYQFTITQDCKAPTVVIDASQKKYNPRTLTFNAYDQEVEGGEHLMSLQDEIIELEALNGPFHKVMSANQFAFAGENTRTLNYKNGTSLIKDENGNELKDGRYKLSVRVHDNAIKDRDSDNARRAFWKSYETGVDMNMPFAQYCYDANWNNTSSCMAHWTKDDVDIVLDFTAPVINSFVVHTMTKNNYLYAGDALKQSLKMTMDVSDEWSDEENPVTAKLDLVLTDLLSNPLRNGYTISQEVTGKYENGKFVFDHEVVKPLTEELRSQLNGYQPIPDGIYTPIVKVYDAAGNSSEMQASAIIVDMNAPVITKFKVPYTTQSGMSHIVTFDADEDADDVSLRNLNAISASVDAVCDNGRITYAPVASYIENGKKRFSFEGYISDGVEGACTAYAVVKDKNGNARRSQASFVINFVPPEITYPKTSQELLGRVVIRGSASNPNLRQGGLFTNYKLLYAEINSEANVVGGWKNTGMSVPESRRCDNDANVSCQSVDKHGTGDDVLGYWDVSALGDAERGKNYRIKLVTSNEGNDQQEAYVDVYVPTRKTVQPEIAISKSTPSSCDFTEADSECDIQWDMKLPIDQNGGVVRMDIMKVNSNDNKTYVEVERMFNEVVPEEFYGAPQDKSARGAYFWIERDDLRKDKNIYHLLLSAGNAATSFFLFFNRTKDSDMQILADGYGSCSSNYNFRDVDDQHSSLTASLNANETCSYIIKGDARARIEFNIVGSNFEYEGGAYEVKENNQVLKNPDGTAMVAKVHQMYTDDPNDVQYAFIGQSAVPFASAYFKNIQPLLPPTSNAGEFVWDGKNDHLASVPTGRYQVVLTLEGLKDGVSATTSKIISVTGKPVEITDVDATPKRIVFDITKRVKNILQPVNATFSFKIDQDAIVSAFVRPVAGGAPYDLHEYMKLNIDGRAVPLNRFYLAGRKDSYKLNWNGRYNGTSQLLPGRYEFVVQVHGENESENREKSVRFSVVRDQLIEDNEIELSVDGGDGKDIKTWTAHGTNYQVAQGMNDAFLQFAPAGTKVSTDNLRVTMGYRGKQAVKSMPFTRYSLGVQLHKRSIDVWAVVAVSFEYRIHYNKYLVGCGSHTRESHRMFATPLTFREGDDWQDFDILFDMGKNGSIHKDRAGKVNTEILLIPRYRLSASRLAELNTTGENASADDQNRNLTELRKLAVADLVWGSDNPYKSKVYDGLTEHSGAKASLQLAMEMAEQPTTNSTSAMWDLSCDVGTKNPNATCLPNGQMPQCPADDNTCGNHIADKGEPLRGSVERYNPNQHAAGAQARLYAWLNHEGKNEDFAPAGGVACAGGSGHRNHMSIIGQIKLSDTFWNNFGDNNLVNRYLVLDPTNDKFLFCPSCPFSDNKTPYLNPNHKQIFDLVDAAAKNGSANKVFIDPLDNPSFYVYVNEVEKTNMVAGDVEMKFHYFEVKSKCAEYASNQFSYEVGYSNTNPNGKEVVPNIPVTGNFVRDGVSNAIPLGGIVGVNTSLPVVISLGNSYPYNLSESYIDWPVANLTQLQQKKCNAVHGCGASELDEELDYSSIKEDKHAQTINGVTYRVALPSVKLGSLGVDNSYDMSVYYEQSNENGTGYSHTQGPKKTIILTYDDKVVVDEAKILSVPNGYDYQNEIVSAKKCGTDDCKYDASGDPLINTQDADQDGEAGEDGNVVSITRDGNYDAKLDRDGDLAMGEDPLDAFRMRLDNLKFDFVAGGEAEYVSYRDYKLSDLIQTHYDLMKSSNSSFEVDEHSVLKADASGKMVNNTNAKTKWEDSDNPQSFTRTKLFYKDGKVNEDVVIMRSSGMSDEDDAASAVVTIGPGKFKGRDRRLLEIKASIPNAWKVVDYKIYASSENGWIDLTPSRKVINTSGMFTGTIAYWDVETSGKHQLMLVCTINGAQHYTILPVYIGAVSDENHTLFSDALGRSQVITSTGTQYLDVVPLGQDEAPQIIPTNGSSGPVVKIYPALSTLDGDVTVRLRLNKGEIDETNSGKFYVVSDGYSPQAVDVSDWQFFDAKNQEIKVGAGNLGKFPENWSYVIISGVVKKSINAVPEMLHTPLGECYGSNGNRHSVHHSGSDWYNVNFNCGANP